MIPINREALSDILECCHRNGFVLVRLVTEIDEKNPPQVHMVMRQILLSSPAQSEPSS